MCVCVCECMHTGRIGRPAAGCTLVTQPGWLRHQLTGLDPEACWREAAALRVPLCSHHAHSCCLLLCRTVAQLGFQRRLNYIIPVWSKVEPLKTKEVATLLPPNIACRCVYGSRNPFNSPCRRHSMCKQCCDLRWPDTVCPAHTHNITPSFASP